MKIRVLGCHGSDQLLEGEVGPRQCRTCGFLINDRVMLDAGAVGVALRLGEQKRISHILLSHLHFDHIQGLPTLADNLVDGFDAPVVLTSTKDVLQGIEEHIFNDRIYPNFFKLPTPQSPVFVTRTLTVGQESEIEGMQVTPVPVNHLVPTVGFLIKQGPVSVLYSGDTYETDDIWAVASKEPTLKAALIESSFPDRMGELARLSKHLTPTLFAEQFRKIGRPHLPVYAYHLKPRFERDIVSELSQQGIANLSVLQEGMELTL